MPVRSRSRSSISRISSLPPSDELRQLVELGVEAAADEAAVAPLRRRLVDERARDLARRRRGTAPRRSTAARAARDAPAAPRRRRRTTRATSARRSGSRSSAARQRHEIARRRHAERGPAGEPLEVVDLAPAPRRSSARKRRVLDEPLDRVVAAADLRHVDAAAPPASGAAGARPSTVRVSSMTPSSAPSLLAAR